MTLSATIARNTRPTGTRMQSNPGYLAAALILASIFHIAIITLFALTRSDPRVGPAGGDGRITVERRRVESPSMTGVIPSPRHEVRPETQDRHAIPTPVTDPVPVQETAVRNDDPRTVGTGVDGVFGGGTSSSGVEGSGGGTSGGEDFGEVEPPPFSFVENPPVPIRQVTPEYPTVARLAGIEGTVYLNLLVDRNGKVKKVKVVKSDHTVFEENAIVAAMEWLFRPAETGNGPVAAWVSVPFRFRLAQR